LFTPAVPRIYPHAPPLNQAFGAQKKSGINAGVNQDDSGVVMDVTREARGKQFQSAKSLRGALNDCGGRRKFPTMSQVLSSIQYICFRKTSGSNTRAPKLLFAPGTI